MARVYLVGAGPGDEGLLTLRGKEVLEKADFIVYDRLVSPEILKMKSPRAQLFYVGKRAGKHCMKQADINLLLDELAGQGTVVRIKGGDPYVFGRGGEEFLFLKKKGHQVEVVPGVTSALAGLAYAGIPATHRSYSNCVHIYTGHFVQGAPDYPWESIVKVGGTAIFLMGLSFIDRIRDGLLAGGMNPNMPVALIRWATTSIQEKYVGTLENLVELKEDNQVQSPALIVVGLAVRLNEDLDFFKPVQPSGRRLALFRREDQGEELAERLKELGHYVKNIPLISSGVLKADLAGLEESDHLVFTSKMGVEGFFANLLGQGRDLRALAGKKIYAIGPRTTQALKDRGILADYQSVGGNSDQMREELEALVGRARIFYPCSNLTDNALLGLEDLVKEAVYETQFLKQDLEGLEEGGYDLIFFSPSQVRAFVQSGGQWETNRIVSIGPISSKELARQGVGVDFELEDHSAQGLIDFYKSLDSSL